MISNIGVVARDIRIKKGITQAYVSNKIGYKHSSSYNDIEAGRRQLKADKVPALAEALGVTVDELFFGDKYRVTRTLGEVPTKNSK